MQGGTNLSRPTRADPQLLSTLIFPSFVGLARLVADVLPSGSSSSATSSGSNDVGIAAATCIAYAAS